MAGVPGSGFRVPGSGFRVPGSGFRKLILSADSFLVVPFS